MEPDHTRLRHQQEQQQSSQTSSCETSQEQGVSFETVEDLLRHDSAQNPIPPEVADRLQQSLAAEPPRKSSWLKKLFG